MKTPYVLGPELQSGGVTAASFEALAEIAVESLRAQGLSGMVCGPITTGGTGHQMLNFEVFNSTINGLQRRGESLFVQVPYEFGLRRLAAAWEAEGNSGYCMPILEVFYARVFESGLITKGWFIPGWESSFGARWERQKLVAQRAVIDDLSRGDIHGFLRQEHRPEHVAEVMALLPA